MAKQMTEEQKVGLLRNALLVAGYEMGETGDHWPVINDTILRIARDWEESRIEKNVDAEMKIHLYEQLEIMENEVAHCEAAVQAELSTKLKELRSIYDSYFCDLDKSAVVPVYEEEMPEYLKRAETIISTLGGDQ